jgi:hypothetical protein
MTISRKLKTVLGDTEGLRNMRLPLSFKKMVLKALQKAWRLNMEEPRRLKKNGTMINSGNSIECGIKLPKHDMTPECIDSPETGNIFKTYYFCTDCT